MKLEKHFEDISFFVVMEGNENDGRVYYVDFKVYKIEAWDEKGVKMFPTKGYVSCSDLTYETEKAQVYLSGSIKSDGCSNMNFDEQDECCLHFCGKWNINHVSQLLLRLYDMAAEIMPDSKEDLQ